MTTADSNRSDNSFSNITDQSRFIINRFDHYFDSINNKGVFYVTLNTFLLGGLLSQVDEIIKSVNGIWWIYTLVLSFVLINVSSTILTILSINPFKSPKSDDTSLLYFHDIALKALNSFKKEYTNQSEDFVKMDFTNQIHQLARGLKIKFDHLRHAGILLLLQFLSLVPIILIAIIK
jgi:hypothetical protein